MTQKIKGSILLVLTALIWGLGFIAQSTGMDYIGPNTFNCLRMFLGSLVLLPIVIRKRRVSSDTDSKSKSANIKLVKSGALCGIILCIATTVQTLGLAYTTPGKSGFITAMYIIFIPIISIILGKKISLRTVLCAATAVVGMYMLCISGGSGTLNFGDFLTLISALLFSFHIMLIDSVASDVDAIKFSFLQFFVCGILNMIVMLLFERPSLDIIKQCIVPILYSGVLACGVGYTLQPVAQQYTDPTTASILMSLESVFALIFGMIVLGDSLTLYELLGSVIMFAAIIIIQLPEGTFKHRRDSHE